MKQILKLALMLVLAVSASACDKSSPFDKYKDPKWHEITDDDTPDTPLPDKPTVEVRNKKLYVNGEEFFVKGAAINGGNNKGDGSNPFYDTAHERGANVVRTYSQINMSVLDDFARKGMYINMGLVIGKESEGFDYNDETARKKQINTLKSVVDRYKNHPAILMWCIGNEVESTTKADGTSFKLNVNVWKDINEIGEYIKKVDGRPVTLAIMGIWSGLTESLKKYIPSLDILCVNNYEGSVEKLNSNYQEAGFDYPYILSEFGIRGTWDWQTPHTDWFTKSANGGIIEPSGNEKAAIYKKIYTDCVSACSDKGCIGSFVFLWGWQSHGDVLNWYAMYDQFEASALPTVEAMEEMWTGEAPMNSAPVIASREDGKTGGKIYIDGRTSDQSIALAHGSQHMASVDATDPDGDELTYDWKIIPDVRQDVGKAMSPIAGLFTGKMGAQVNFKAPSATGYYRLIVYVRDKAHGTASCAVIPFKVN